MNGDQNIIKRHRFPPAQYAHFPIEKLAPEEIDELLANGYFRNGLNVLSALGRYVDGEWKPNVMLRIPLENFQWKKRSRKLLRRNAKHFEVRVGPLNPREEIEELWYLFKTEIHQWENVARITEYLLRGRPASNFNAFELCVYHEDKLVAFSIFDKGCESIASLEAAYHPDFQKYSLGYFTMLLEIAHAVESELKWYYPGFYPKGLSMFDYKMRPGGIEFFRLKERKWEPWAGFSEDDWLADKVERKLLGVKNLIREKRIPSELLTNFHSNTPSEVKKAGDYQVFLKVILLVNKVNRCQVKICFDILLNQFLVFSQNLILVTSTQSILTGKKRFVPSGPYHFLGMADEAESAIRLMFNHKSSSGKTT